MTPGAATDLAAFFAEMKPFLLGERSAEAVLARLGPSPSGAHRFALYAELVARQRRAVMDGFYRCVAAAAMKQSPSLFPRLSDEYLRAHPPTHWSPNELARAFPAFLNDHRDADDELRALADFAWVRFAAMHAAHDGDDVGLDRAIFVRHYDCDVATFVDDVDARGAESAILAKAPRTVLVGRHRHTGLLVVVTPSLAALVALATASRVGEKTPALPAGLSWALVLDGARELEDLGLVSNIAERVQERSGGRA